jgi:integrase
MIIRLKYVKEDVDRHGNVRLYFRKGRAPKIRLPRDETSPEFLAAYRAALAGVVPAKPKRQAQVVKESLRWLCGEYYKSAKFKALDPKTQRVRRAILERLCRKSGDKAGDLPYRLVRPKHIRKWCDELSETPEAANARLKAIRQLFAFACKYEELDVNPAIGIEYISSGSTGFHSWTIEEVRKYEDFHPIGTKARLAMALLLYTVQRRSDMVRFGRQHVRDGRLVFTQFKGRNKKPVKLKLPIIPQLQRIIDASPCGELAFLVTDLGQPFTANGFGNKMRQWCDQAGLPHCTAHGLRKASMARLAELGLSEAQMKGASGHKTSKEVNRYTEAARQEIMAEQAMDAFSRALSENESGPLSEGAA